MISILPAREVSEAEATEKFLRMARRIQKDYVHTTSLDKLLHGALRGMVESLDINSTYMSAEEFQQIKTQVDGHYGGLGIDVILRRGRLIIISVADASPAYVEGLEVGDIILKINDKNLTNSTMTEAVNMLRGRKGTKVTLTIRRGSSDVFSVDLERDSIKSLPVKWEVQHDVGIITIPGFISQTTAGDIRSAVLAAQKDNPNLNALVLDLRDNDGGLLDQGIDAVSLFLSSGRVVYTKGRGDKPKDVYKVKLRKEIARGIPIVILVNRETASTAEIFAGALRDHKRALIVGERTFGKGSIQDLIALKDNDAMKLTTEYFYTPSDQKIDNVGIKPDIIITQPKVTFTGVEEDTTSSMKKLKLENDPKITDTDTVEPGQRLAQDPQLYQAIFIAQGLRFGSFIKPDKNT
ncbi:MAG: S41 family peptidase [Alphaproteobacteria bacterium]|nr:MAG: S41 family peptidase [Alphaproteobacteria bacterium]